MKIHSAMTVIFFFLPFFVYIFIFFMDFRGRCSPDLAEVG